MKKDSWLYSDSFLKRAFAIYGYNMVASLMIAIPFIILWFLFLAVVIGVGFSNMGNWGDDSWEYGDEERMPMDGMMENGGMNGDGMMR